MKNLERKIHTRKKNGFTLLELIFAIVVVAIIISLIYPTIIANKNKAVISSTVGNDAKLISQAVTQWKGSSSNSNGSYSNLTTAAIAIYLPNTMKYNSSGGYIESSGLNGGIHYQVISDKINSNGDSFKVFENFAPAIAQNHWNNRLISYAEKVGMDAFHNLSTNKATAGAAPEEGTATALGSANADFKTGGTDTDGEDGVRQIVF